MVGKKKRKKRGKEMEDEEGEERGEESFINYEPRRGKANVGRSSYC